MKLRYTGPHDEVEVVMPDGGSQLVKKRGHLETTVAHGRALLAQEDQWAEVKDAAEPPTTTDAKE